MKLSAVTTDNITEVLLKIIEFTQTRQRLLTLNIRNVRKPGYEPKDLEVDQFSEILNKALTEYTQNQRLIFCDTRTIKFTEDGNFRLIPITDDYAKKLLEHNLDEYLELQTGYLLENSLNQRIATQLLRQRQGIDFTASAAESAEFD